MPGFPGPTRRIPEIDMQTQEMRTKGSALFIKILIPILILALGGAAAVFFHKTAPKVKRVRPPKQAQLVEVVSAHKADAAMTIACMGTVVPSREVVLKAEVEGRVEWVSETFVPGGLPAKGEDLLRLDSGEYEIEVEKNRGAVAKAQADVDLEGGQQKVARQEYEGLSEVARTETDNTDLILRKPNLRQVQASLDIAKADLEKALLDLERTTITAPFNGLVTEISVNVGSRVGTQDSLLTLVGTDEYWVEALVPLDRLGVIDLESSGGAAAVVRSLSGEGMWNGRALRLTGALTDTTRMATVLVSVADPLGLKREVGGPPLLLGDYVNVEIQGRVLHDVMELPRGTLREGGVVWVLRDGALDARDVSVAWKEGNSVFVDAGLEEGDQVIVSDISSPVPGMALAVLDRESGATPDSPANSTQGGGQ